MKSKQRWLAALVILVLAIVVIPVLRADDDDHDDHQEPAGKVSLEHEMGAMGKAYKIIRKQVADPKQNASTLAAVLELEQHTVLSKGAVLRSAATMPTEDAKKAKQADFQGDMITLLRHELDLEEALLANQNDKAVKIVADLHDLESEGHKEFRPRRRD
jgi:hypothetical protein